MATDLTAVLFSTGSTLYRCLQRMEIGVTVVKVELRNCRPAPTDHCQGRLELSNPQNWTHNKFHSVSESRGVGPCRRELVLLKKNIRGRVGQEPPERWRSGSRARKVPSEEASQATAPPKRRARVSPAAATARSLWRRRCARLPVHRARRRYQTVGVGNVFSRFSS